MQAIEVEATVSEDHCIHVQLPDDWVSKKVKVVILQKDEETKSTPRKEPRQFGQFPGEIEISDDFDQPLPDQFWLGGKPCL